HARRARHRRGHTGRAGAGAPAALDAGAARATLTGARDAGGAGAGDSRARLRRSRRALHGKPPAGGGAAGADSRRAAAHGWSRRGDAGLVVAGRPRGPAPAAGLSRAPARGLILKPASLFSTFT